jgi:hypothetical protein
MTPPWIVEKRGTPPAGIFSPGAPPLPYESGPGIEINFPGPCPKAREAKIITQLIMPRKEMSLALAPVSGSAPAVELVALPAAAAVSEFDCLSRPPRQELAPMVELQEPAG